MSPFIVTTTRSCNCEPSTCESDGLLYHETRCGVFNVPRSERESRLAVASLEDARTACAGKVWDAPHIATVVEFYALLDEAFNLPESGGTVGPLPDGTTIQVEPVTYHALWHAVPWHMGLRGGAYMETEGDQNIAAFNVFHAKRELGGSNPSKSGSSGNAEPEAVGPPNPKPEGGES